ncbi:MAG: phospholipase D-like domain-containing protein [Candidatus Melainabacteria bacterium]|nr:phospholipase D-like domain-containing protein [Candidatus Melainabacteria bacterium]
MDTPLLQLNSSHVPRRSSLVSIPPVSVWAGSLLPAASGSSVWPLKAQQPMDRFQSGALYKPVVPPVASPLFRAASPVGDEDSGGSSATPNPSANRSLQQFSPGYVPWLRQFAHSLGMTAEQLIETVLPQHRASHAERSVLPPKTVTLHGLSQGKTKTTQVTSLMDAQQIFEHWQQMIRGADRYVQIAMYDFDNVLRMNEPSDPRLARPAVDTRPQPEAWTRERLEARLRDIAGPNGTLGRSPDMAYLTPAWRLQQAVLIELLLKALDKRDRGEPFKIQLILDSSNTKAYSEYGDLIADSPSSRSVNNAEMVQLLRDFARQERLDLTVVHYPRELAKIYHMKLLIVDGIKAIVGGMNLSNHSAANWDACVALQGDEVANLQAKTFYPDWVVGRAIEAECHPEKATGTPFDQFKKKQLSAYATHPEYYEQYQQELPSIAPFDYEGPVSQRPFEVLNTTPAEYRYFRLKLNGKTYRLIPPSQNQLAQTKSRFTTQPSGQPVTAKPPEDTSLMGHQEGIGEYLKATVKHPQLQEVRGAQFIISHPYLVNELLNAWQTVPNFVLKLLMGLGVQSQFPYTRKAEALLFNAGGSEIFRPGREDQSVGQKLHSKLFMWKLHDPDTEASRYETLIGSANCSEAALETNVTEGTRSSRRFDSPYSPDNHRYDRGNREAALVIRSNELGDYFVQQHEKDWQFSEPQQPGAYGGSRYTQEVEAFDPHRLSSAFQLPARSSSPPLSLENLPKNTQKRGAGE